MCGPRQGSRQTVRQRSARRRQPVRVSGSTRSDTERNATAVVKSRSTLQRACFVTSPAATATSTAREVTLYLCGTVPPLPPASLALVPSLITCHRFAAGPVLGPPPVHLKARSRSTNEHAVCTGSGHSRSLRRAAHRLPSVRVEDTLVNPFRVPLPPLWPRPSYGPRAEMADCVCTRGGPCVAQ